MTEAARHWPVEFMPLLAGLHASDQPGCYHVDLDVSEKELTGLNLFEAGARHHKVLVPLPGIAGTGLGFMNVILGLGAPDDPAGHVARVRVSFSEMQPV
jgi:hypothetical protein